MTLLLTLGVLALVFWGLIAVYDHVVGMMAFDKQVDDLGPED